MLGFDTDMQPPVSLLEKIEYKKQYIKKFGTESWKAVHEGKPQTTIDANGKKVVRLVIPEMPTELYLWLREKGWSLQLYVQSVVGETNDLGSNIQYNAAEAGAAISNKVEDIKDAATAGIVLVKRVAIAAAVLGVAYLFRAELFGLAKAELSKGRK